MDRVAAWARERGVEVLLPEQFPDEPERDPRGDAGRVVRGSPTHVLRPADVDALAATLRFLTEAGLRYRLRGAAYSTGGQVVADGGAVVDLTRLDRIVEDRPDAGELTVQGGATWLAVGAELRRTGRRPLVQPDNLHMTVGGTLALGGFGDTSGVHGPAISQVVRLTLVTPDGELRRLGDDDELFRLALGGVGLLGAIAEVTLRTVRRPPTVVSRTLAWGQLEQFGLQATVNTDLRLYELFQGAVSWPDGAPVVHVVAGQFAAAVTPNDPGLWEIKPSATTAPAVVDRFEALSAAPSAWDQHRPTLQLVATVPLGLALLEHITERVRAEAILRAHLPRVGLLVFPTDTRFPLAAQPAAPVALALVVRPQVADRAALDALLPILRALGAHAVEAGASVGPASIALGISRLAERQLGPALQELRRVKSQVDPRWLCNDGVLEGLAQS